MFSCFLEIMIWWPNGLQHPVIAFETRGADHVIKPFGSENFEGSRQVVSLVILLSGAL
jgi:hypothetical protein